MAWRGIVLWSCVFLSGTVRCVHFASQNRLFEVILGSSGGHFGTLWLHFGGLGLPRGPQGDPLQAKADFQQIWGGFAPPFGVPILVHFRQKYRKIELQKRNFLRLVVDSPFFYKMVEK